MLILTWQKSANVLRKRKGEVHNGLKITVLIRKIEKKYKNYCLTHTVHIAKKECKEAEENDHPAPWEFLPPGNISRNI